MAKKATTKTSPALDKKYGDVSSKIDALMGIMGKSKIGQKGGRIQRGSAFPEIPRFSSGSPRLDAALGGGWPRCGKIVEIFGAESSGKTTLALHAVAEMQKLGGLCYYLDAEQSFHEEWARSCGVNTDELVVYTPSTDSGEDMLNKLTEVVETGLVRLVVIDSVAALVPRAELEGQIGDSHVGLLARMLSQAMRKFVNTIEAYGCTVIFLNQIRMKIGVMFGNPETTPGGKAIPFAASIRLSVRRSTYEKDGEDAVGNKVILRTVKNKTFAPQRKAETFIRYKADKDGKIVEGGLDIDGEIVDLAIEQGAVGKSGSWYHYVDPSGEEIRVGQGKAAVLAKMRAEKGFAEYLRGVADGLPLESLSPPLTPEQIDAERKAEVKAYD